MLLNLIDTTRSGLFSIGDMVFVLEEKGKFGIVVAIHKHAEKFDFCKVHILSDNKDETHEWYRELELVKR